MENNSPLISNNLLHAVTFALDMFNDNEFKKLKSEIHKNPLTSQTYHKIFEVILGGFLKSNGFNVKYEKKIEGKTPDWSIFNEKKELIAIIEMFYLHIDMLTTDEIYNKWKKNGSIRYFPNKTKNTNRLYEKLEEKAQKYLDLILTYEIPYIISIRIGDFNTINKSDIEELLADIGLRIFERNTCLSGIYLIDSSYLNFNFEFFKNPYALNAFSLPSGEFPGKNNVPSNASP